MKIALDLDHSINNYNWTKEELEKFVPIILDTLWGLYEKDKQEDILTDEEKLRLYDILDMFNSYEVETNKNIQEMSLIEILEYVKDVYGNDETTNLYIRCLGCDEYIPIYEWEEHEDLLEFEKCKDCKEYDEQYIGDE